MGKFKIHPKTGIVYAQRGFTAGQEYDLRVSQSLHCHVLVVMEICVSWVLICIYFILSKLRLLVD